MPKKQSDGRYRTKIVIGHSKDGKPIVKWAQGRTKAELETDKRGAVAETAPTRRKQKRQRR